MRTVILTVLVGLAFAAVPPCEAEILPPAGTFTGYYRADRWGNHSFRGFPVEPKARDAFKGYEDQLVTADLQGISQPIRPGPGFVGKVGKITPIKDAAIDIQLAWADNPEGSDPRYRRTRPNDTFKFKVTITNKSDKAFGPATVNSDGFFLTGIGAVQLHPQDDQLDGVADFRHSRANAEWKDARLEVDAGKSHTWTVTMKNARAGEFEFHVYFVEYRDGSYLQIESNTLRLDVVDATAKLAAGLELVLIPDANPPRPPRPIPAKLTFKNTNDKPLNIFLPYRKDKLAEDQLLRCFDPSGTLILGARDAASAEEVFNRDFDTKQQRLDAGASLTFDVSLPHPTAFAAAQFRGMSILDKSRRKPGELYFDTAGPATSGYFTIRR